MLQYILISFKFKVFSDLCKFFAFFAETASDCLHSLLLKELDTIVSIGIVLSYTMASNEKHTEPLKVKYSPNR